MVNDRLMTAVLDANSRVHDVTFLALLGRPDNPLTICMCADYLIPLTIYQGNNIDEGLSALANTVITLEQARKL
ncbi:MAG: hypothetical protein WCK65_15510 [Rhodospirillaceae bacterium]